MTYKSLVNILNTLTNALINTETTEDRLEILNEITRTVTILHQTVYDADPAIAYDLLVDSGVAKPFTCFQCNSPIYANDDAGVCIKCGGMNKRR